MRDNNFLPITPEEALKIFDRATIGKWETAKELLTIYEARYGETVPRSWDTIRLLAFLYDAGRVQGIREERARRAGRRSNAQEAE